MSIYESISKSQIRLKQRLFDEHIKNFGEEMYILRLKFQEDIFQDLSDIEVLSKDVIPIIIRFPDEIPIDRLRGDNEEVDSSRVFFFDLLPIEVYARFSDKVENKDILFFYYGDDNGNKIPFILQITEKFAKISPSGIEWMKCYATKYNGALSKNVLEDLTNYYQGELEGNELVRTEKENPDQKIVREKRLNQILRE